MSRAVFVSVLLIGLVVLGMFSFSSPSKRSTTVPASLDLPLPTSSSSSSSANNAASPPAPAFQEAAAPPPPKKKKTAPVAPTTTAPPPAENCPPAAPAPALGTPAPQPEPATAAAGDEEADAVAAAARKTSLQIKTMCEPHQPNRALLKFLQSHERCKGSDVSDVVAVRFGDSAFLERFAPTAPPAGDMISAARKRDWEADKAAAAVCRRREASLVEHMNETLEKMGPGPTCVARVIRKMAGYLELQKLEEKRAKAALAAAGVSSATSSSSSSSSAFKCSKKQAEKPIRITVAAAINNGGQHVLFENSRLILLHRWLEVANPATDELHILTDHWSDGQREMARTARNILFRRRAPQFAPTTTTTAAPTTTTSDRSKQMEDDDLSAEKSIKQQQSNSGLASSSTPTTAASPFNSSLVDLYVAKVRVFNTRLWALGPAYRHTARHQPGTNGRIFLISYWLDIILPKLSTLLKRDIGVIMHVDMRDTLFQGNAHDAIDALNLGQKLGDNEYTFAIGERDRMVNSLINQLWSADFLGKAQKMDIVIYDASRPKAARKAQEDAPELDDPPPPAGSPWSTAPRRQPDGSYLPVACSGFYGGTFKALAQQLTMFRQILDCAPDARHGLDQGAYIAMVFFAQHATFLYNQSMFPFLLLSPTVGPLRHFIPRDLIGSWPRTPGGKLANCRGEPYALLHQIDRHPSVWKKVEQEAFNFFNEVDGKNHAAPPAGSYRAWRASARRETGRGDRGSPIQLVGKVVRPGSKAEGNICPGTVCPPQL